MGAARPAPPSSCEAGALVRFAGIERAARTARAPAAKTRLLVAIGSCSLAVGAAETLAALAREAGRRGVDIAIGTTGCTGACWAAPVVAAIEGNGGARFLARVTAERAAEVIEAVAGSQLPPGDPELAAFLAGQRRELTARCGLVDPDDIADAIRHGVLRGARPGTRRGPPRARSSRRSGRPAAGPGRSLLPDRREVGGRAARRRGPVEVSRRQRRGGRARHLQGPPPDGGRPSPAAGRRRSWPPMRRGRARVLLYMHGEAELSAARLARAVERRAGGGCWARGSSGALLGRGRAETRGGRVRARRGDGADRVDRGPPGHAAGRARRSRWSPAIGAAHRHQQRRDAVRGAPHRRAGRRVVRRARRRPRDQVFGLSGTSPGPASWRWNSAARSATLVEDVGGGSDRPAAQGGRAGRPVGHRRAAAPVRRAAGPRRRREPRHGRRGRARGRRSVRDAARALLDFNTRESCGKCTPCREGTARLLALLDGRPCAAPAGRRSWPRWCISPRSAASARRRRCPSCPRWRSSRTRPVSDGTMRPMSP